MLKWKSLKIFLIICFFIIQTNGLTQYYSSGQDPASIKWMQIKTEYFQIIFPQGYEENAQFAANVLEFAYAEVVKSMKIKPKKISVLLHTSSVLSNGVTAWAPKRLDLFMTPPQDTYADSWINQLAIHELRHVIQINKLNTGLTKILSILFGEQAKLSGSE